MLTRDAHGRRVIAAACSLALAAGIAVGRSVSDALALESRLLVVAADPAADRLALAGLADWCGRYTPQVALDPMGGSMGDGMGDGGLWLDVTGCAHLFGGEAALLADLVNRLASLGRWSPS